MCMGSNDVTRELRYGPKERIKNLIDELLATAEDQLDFASDIVDILHELRVEMMSLIAH